jgi:hypothetical protein
MKKIDYIKANRKGSREAELEFEKGFVSNIKSIKIKKHIVEKRNIKIWIIEIKRLYLY